MKLYSKKIDNDIWTLVDDYIGRHLPYIEDDIIVKTWREVDIANDVKVLIRDQLKATNKQ